MSPDQRDQAKAQFLAEYLVDRSMNAASKRVGISMKLATQFAKEPEFQAAVEMKVGELAARAEVTAAEVLSTLASIMRDPGKRDGDRLKAAELLGKHLALFVERVEVTDLTDAAERVKAARERAAALARN